MKTTVQKLAIAAVALTAVLTFAPKAEAHTDLIIGLNAGGGYYGRPHYAPYPYYAPAPVYYAPAPVVYADPAPVYYAPPAPVYIAPPRYGHVVMEPRYFTGGPFGRPHVEYVPVTVP